MKVKKHVGREKKKLEVEKKLEVKKVESEKKLEV